MKKISKLKTVNYGDIDFIHQTSYLTDFTHKKYYELDLEKINTIDDIKFILSIIRIPIGDTFYKNLTENEKKYFKIKKQ